MLRSTPVQVSLAGDWQAVLSKCARGRIQPYVLFFSQQPSRNPRGWEHLHNGS